MGFAEIWAASARANGFEVYADDPRFTRLWELLSEANARMNLTAIRSEEGTAVLHFCDSLTALPHIPPNARLIDVGCGGGFPCLPLALARPDLNITALDSTAKKLTFVKDAADSLGLENITVLAARAEEAGRLSEYREHFDCAVARAVAPLGALAEICLPFVRRGGVFVAMKSRGAEEELRQAEPAVAGLGGRLAENRELTLRFPDPAEDGDAERRLLIFKKTSPTPAGYPRKWAQIKKGLK